MGCFEVLESGEGIQDEIARRLQDTGALACGWSSPSRPALLIISPQIAAKTPHLEGGCRTVLLPGDAPAEHWQLQAASAVSYGPGPPGHSDPVQPGGRSAVAGPPAGGGHRPGPGGGASGVSLSLHSSPAHSGRTGGGGGSAFAGSSPGASELAFAISYLTSRDLWTTIKIPPTPGGCHP